MLNAALLLFLVISTGLSIKYMKSSPLTLLILQLTLFTLPLALTSVASGISFDYTGFCQIKDDKKCFSKQKTYKTWRGN